LDNSKKKPRNRALQLSGIGIQMGATIFLGAYFGKWLDAKYPHDRNWFTILFTLLAVGLSLYIVVKDLNKMNEQDKK